MSILSAAKDVLRHNGGPIDGDDGVAYVMVRRLDLDALVRALYDYEAAQRRTTQRPCGQIIDAEVISATTEPI